MCPEDILRDTVVLSEQVLHPLAKPPLDVHHAGAGAARHLLREVVEVRDPRAHVALEVLALAYASGIEVVERVKIPDGLIPPDAQVEMQAKMAAGYFSDGTAPDATKLEGTKGRGLGD